MEQDRPKVIKQHSISFDSLDAATQRLINESVNMRNLAYCPYSKFKVGAAVQSESGNYYTGCNVECASYGATICAERTAIVKAISYGDSSLKQIAVCADLDNQIISPCGICRQFIIEFSKDKDISIYLTNSKLDTIIKTSIRELLPMPFTEFKEL